jgi:2-polyprenyl-3-methyl-5-hydroxy-6-metoxy-1,4-benzoquinol methylase
MTWLDNYLQCQRIAQARVFLPAGSRVLDIGCADGALFKMVSGLGQDCMGVDPRLKKVVSGKNYRLIPGMFPQDLPSAISFDAITLLAVLEHFFEPAYESLAAGCYRFLKPNGRLILTVPSPKVDRILAILKRLRLVHGMSLEDHHEFDVRRTLTFFREPNFRLIRHRTFQFGLNHLFVFERIDNLGL